jgi:hypothetical protein
MRKASLALIICISVHVQSLHALCKTEACKKATAWKNGYTAIVLDDNISRADYFAVLDAVKANKGVVAIEAERVLLGWIPIAKAGKIRAARGVSSVLYEAVATPANLVHRDDALAALSYFNRVRSGEFEDAVEAGLAVHGPPLSGCVAHNSNGTPPRSQSIRSVLFDTILSERASVVQSAVSNPADIEEPVTSPALPGVVRPMYGLFQQPYRNTQMRGRITVQLFRLDSAGPDADGLTTTNLYTWTNADFGTSRDQVYSAFTFWVDQAAARGITLSFRIVTEDPFNRYTRSIFPTPVNYEPIKHTIGDDYKWINDALAPLGYGSSPITPDNVYTKNEAFNVDKAADPLYGPFDGSFTLYVVYDPDPAHNVYADGTASYVGFQGGPYAMVSWDAGGWGPQNLGRAITHETGHIFWACDEHSSGCFTCDDCFYNVGPHNKIQTPWVTNANCEHPSIPGTCDSPLTQCMMKLNDYTLCPHTPGQIGW